MAHGEGQSGVDSPIVRTEGDTPHVGGTISPEVASEVGEALAQRGAHIPTPTYQEIKKLAAAIIGRGVEKGAVRSAIQVYAPTIAQLKGEQFAAVKADFLALETAMLDQKAAEIEREMTWVEDTIRQSMTEDQARDALLIAISEFLIGAYQGEPSDKMEALIEAKKTFILAMSFGK